MRRNYFKIFRKSTIFIVSALGFILIVLLLHKSNFFQDFKSSEFNNIVTPIATILAFIVYYATLIEIRNSNNKNINFQKLSLLKERIENLKAKLENSKVKIPYQFKEKIENSHDFNLTNFLEAYELVHRDMLNNIKKGNNDIQDHEFFFFNICFQYRLKFDYISKLLHEIKNSDFESLEKSILNEMLQKILNDYLYVISIGKSLNISFNYTDANNKTIKVKGYDVPFYSLPQNELTTVFVYTEFDVIYNLMEEHKII